MKCPHCEYEEFNKVNGRWEINAKGEFYYLPIEMESKDKDRRKVVGCPNCFKIFMKDY
jgi:hypothetical protein